VLCPNVVAKIITSPPAINYISRISTFCRMSSDFPNSSSGTDIKYEIRPTSSPPTSPNETQLAHSALAYVTNNGHDLENLEPALAALSASAQQSPHPHVSDQHGNGLSIAPAETTRAMEIATSTLTSHGLNIQSTNDTPKAKRLNRACDACSKRKVKVGRLIV
jgi:hypothetical protein